MESAEFMNQAFSRTAPDFVIAGAPKCGTTSLHHWLNQHPGLFIIRGEPHFFATDIDYNLPRMTASQYRALCAKAGTDRLCGERSTWYMHSKTAAREIHDANPDARIIMIVRQPADMLYSLHAHFYRRRRRENIASLAQAMALESERRVGRSVPPRGGFPEKFRYSELPRYSEQIQRFSDQFGPDQVRVIVFDDLRTDPGKVYIETLNFLGVSSDFIADFEVYNRSAPVRDSVLSKLWKTGTWRYRARSLTPQWLQDHQLKRRQRQRNQAARRRPWPAISEELRTRLTRDFNDEINRLEGLIERDLSAWRQHPQES